MYRIIGLLLISLLISCVGQNTASNRIDSDSTNDTDTTDNGIDKEVVLPYDVYWFTTQIYQTSLIVNSSTETNVYIRGNQINNFLKNDSNFYKDSLTIQTYCLNANYSSIGAKKSLRVLAIPAYSNPTGVDQQERYFKVLLSEDASTNEASCTGTVGSIGDTDTAFNPKDLCPTCYSTINSTSIELYKVESSVITDSTLIPDEDIELTGFQLVVDNSSSITDPTPLCTDSSCQGQGKDCCYNDTQCVTNKAIKPNAEQDPQYQTAIDSVKADPTNILKWPNIYFLCPNMNDDVVIDPDDPGETDIDAEIKQQVENYECIKSYSENWETNSSAIDYSSCTLSPNFDALVGGTVEDYKYVKQHVLKRCQCPRDELNPFPPYNAEPLCSDWGLELTYDGAEVEDNINGTICSIIEDEDNDNATFTMESLSLPARSVPHRFFEKISGLPIDDLSELDSTAEQEGEDFYYQDPIKQTDPNNGSFNINSVLGPIKVDLSMASPAYVVDLDANQPYIITTKYNSGSYTSCPECVADSWSNSYFAHPADLMEALGLRTIGFESSRQGTDSYSGTKGNYEDTIFGRACWVPPTMLPFSHRPRTATEVSSTESDLQVQRKARLATQTAYFVNGYQRDWFGFNKGAVIGSFNGVSWFAIGKARRVISTTGKLFLAMNAPFGDLAAQTATEITVKKNDLISEASSYDYDINLSNDADLQNKAGSCQRFHMCSTDTDCITQLGWEYSCADISKYKTSWPKFSTDSDEISNSEVSEATFLKDGVIIQLMPSSDGETSSNRKRCVYRGAGSPCKVNYSTLEDKTQKLFTCAPNFYCSSLTNNDFNSQIARSTGELETIIYGQEADVLGRPLDYITRTTTSSLPDLATKNIQHNASIYGTDITDWGICRPGKLLVKDEFNSHANSDIQKRTDFISQISSCDSTQNGSARAETCPVIDEDEDSSTYLQIVRTPTDATQYIKQNMCGGESLNYASVSAFASIEQDTLSVITDILSPTLAKDACLRRAGAVCQTDFDCGPNLLHSKASDKVSLSYFGGTLAEKEYWNQYLVCGQREEAPADVTNARYTNYDLTINRCCREVGKNLTIYTEGPEDLDKDYDDSNDTLDVASFSYNNPRQLGRYSRYSTLGSFTTPTDPDVPVHAKPEVEMSATIPLGLQPEMFQWKSINDTAKRTCCGSGFVRKFADGTNNWSNNKRLSLDVSNFQCLNYSTKTPRLTDTEVDEFNVDLSNYKQEGQMFCVSPSIDGCMEAPISPANLFEITLPTQKIVAADAALGTAQNTSLISTSPILRDGESTSYPVLNRHAPFVPLPFLNPIPMSGDGLNYISISSSDILAPEGISVHLPSYIGGEANIVSVKLDYITTDVSTGDPVYNNPLRTLSKWTDATYAPTAGECTIPGNPVVNGMADDTWCIDSSGKYEVLHAKASRVQGWAQVGLVITFRVAQTSTYVYKTAAASTMLGATAGNSMYYLTKLGRLELVGIPQIFYDPLYCNDAKDELVEGIYDSSIKTRSDFYDNSFIFQGTGRRTLNQLYDEDSAGLGFTYTGSPQTSDYTNSNSEAVFSNKLDVDPIFSSNDFLCCSELGSKTYQPSNCCSGFGVLNDNLDEAGTVPEYICKLPTGTDLNVYLNRFVSGEGTDLDDDTIELVDADFIPETGEPKMTESVYTKIRAIGIKFCSSGRVRKGAAFGYYYAGNNGTYQQYESDDGDCSYRQYQMLDNVGDNEGATNCDPGASSSSSQGDLSINGYSNYSNGFRWNHHYYCAPAD